MSIQVHAILGGVLTALVTLVAVANPSDPPAAPQPAAPQLAATVGPAPEAAAPTSDLVCEEPTAEFALVSPITLADCAAGAADCCNPACKPNLTGCCVANGCGLPKVEVLRGKLAFTGMTVHCPSLLAGGAY